LRALLVVGDDAGIDLLAHGEALGALLVTVARQVVALDEGFDAGFDEANFEAAILDGDHFAGDDGILAQFAGRGGVAGRITRKLLDAERDALLLDIDVEHLAVTMSPF
jgi:hypothetical protein